MRILHLTLKKKWFDMILSGEKKEEYREIKPYWENRIQTFEIFSRNSHSSFKQAVGFKPFDVVRFTNGYKAKAPTMDVKIETIQIGQGEINWGAEKDKDYFIIGLGKILSTKNIQQ